MLTSSAKPGEMPSADPILIDLQAAREKARALRSRHAEVSLRIVLRDGREETYEVVEQTYKKIA